MATNEQKYEALKSAIDAGKEHARSGYTSPAHTIEVVYNTIINIIDEIERSGK